MKNSKDTKNAAKKDESTKHAPVTPRKSEKELSDSDLEKVAGGGGHGTKVSQP